MVLINFKILHGVEENHDIISYCSSMMLLIPAFFSGYPHFPNLNVIILCKAAEYLSNVCAREIVDRGDTVFSFSLFFLLLHLFFPPHHFNLEPCHLCFSQK